MTIEMPSTDIMNLQNYKDDSENYHKLKKKLVRCIDSQTMLDELKRRKVTKMNHITDKYEVINVPRT